MKIKREDREIELKKYAQELGVSLQGTYDGERFLEAEVVNRIIKPNVRKESTDYGL